MTTVLHLLASNRYSGAENVVCQIIQMTTAPSADAPAPCRAAYCSPDGQISQALAERGIRFIPLQKLSVAEVKRAIREYQPDIIHAHDMRASLIAALACGKIPLISHVHNNNPFAGRLSLKGIAYAVAARKASHIFWVSESAYNGYTYRDKFAAKSSVLYNVVNPNEILSRMARDTNAYDYDVVFCGRLTAQKNPLRLLDVCTLLAQKKPDVKIAIVGSGEMDDEVRAKASSLNLTDNVTFLGFQSNPLKIVHDAKAMVMTSLWEGTPMCALEAMVLGTPIVSTPVDGLKVLVTNGENGFLSDDNADLADKLYSIITDPSLRASLSQKQMEKAAAWNDSDKYKGAVLQSYAQCVTK